MAEENTSPASGSRRRRRGSRRNILLLPEELQEEILGHLPTKAVTRFESVCKTWRSKFHSRSFIELYGRRHLLSYNNHLHTIQLEALLKIHGSRTKPRERSFAISCYEQTMDDPVSCSRAHEQRHLLLDLPSEIWLSVLHCPTHDYKFTNPFPDCIRARLEKIASKPCYLYIGFGRIDSPLALGGGGGDYKVVVIANYGKSFSSIYSSFVALVYSFQSGEWRKIVDYKRRRGSDRRNEAFHRVARRFQYITNSFEACPQSFLEGCWHWSAMGEYGPDHTFHHYVLSFSFANEAFKLIGAPWRNQEEDVNTMGAVSVLHDHLAFIYLSRSGHVVAEVDVWMMMEYGVEDSWTRIYKTNPDYYGGFSSFLGIDSIYTPAGGDGDGESGVVRVQRLFFEDARANHQVISCDEVGHQVLRRDLCEESGRWSRASTNSTNFFLEYLWDFDLCRDP